MICNFLYIKMIILIYTDELNIIIEQFKRIGYFYTFKTHRYVDNINTLNTERVITYNFSPYKQNELIKKQTAINDYLYHICPKYVLNKIKKQGLIPKTKNSEFIYDERIHLCCSNITYDDLIYLRNYLDKNNNSKLNKHKYVLLTINVNKLPKNIQFFRDLDSKNGIYTYDPIPSYTIDKIEEI